MMRWRRSFKEYSFAVVAIWGTMFFGVVRSDASELRGISLQESYEAALKRSETLSDQDEQWIQAQERESQAKGALLPNVSGNATYFIQQAPSDPIAREFFPSTQPTVKLTLSQPLFRGLREFATLRKLRHLTTAQKYQRDQTLLQIYSSVAQEFFQMLSLKQEINNLKRQVDLYQERALDLHRRAKSGQSSSNEPLAAEALRAGVQAQVKQMEGQYKTADEEFSFLTGFPRGTELSFQQEMKGENFSLKDYLNSLEHRPDLLSAKEKIEAFDEQISTAKGEHLPTVDLQGNYYLVRPVGVMNDIHWDVQAVLSLPLYSGGMVQSKVRESISQRAQAEMALIQARRVAEKDVRSLFLSYQSDREQIQALEESVRLSEKNYLVLKKDYSRGLARNLDVLQALTQFQDNKRALDRARWSARSNLVRLRIIAALEPLMSNTE